MDRNFGGVIWTNHALERLRDRGIKQGDAWATWRNPDQSRYGSEKGTWVYYKTYGDQKIEVVAKQNERKEWLILSVWSRKATDSSSYQGNKNSNEKSFLNFIINKLFKRGV